MAGCTVPDTWPIIPTTALSTVGAGGIEPISDIGASTTAPLAEWLRRKRGPESHVTRAAWVQFPPSPTHETCLLCSAMSGLMKLACLLTRQAQRNIFHTFQFTVCV